MGAGEVIKDIWPLEVATITKRNNVRLRRWGMQVTVTDDVTPANNTTWVLVKGHVDSDKKNNSNWQTLSDFAGGGAGVGVFAANVTFVLSAGKSFGKYTNGQTAPWAGLTAVQAILNAAIEYINPAFSSFSISGQATTVEVGTTISGSKTFLWAITLNSGAVATIDLYDITASATLLANTPNDGSQAQVVTTNQLNANAAAQSFRGILHDTNVVQNINSAPFTITARFFRFYAPSATSPVNSAAVRALANSAFQLAGAVFNLLTGTVETKFVVSLPPGVTIVSVFDLDALNANITAQYVLTGTVNVLDAGGTNRAYNIYEMNVGSPYSTSHRHQITTS